MAKIFNLSEATSIALHSMVLIAKSKIMLNASIISDQIGSSRHHIAKVMQRLVKDGMLESTRGPLGGFVLKKSPAKINLLQIYESIEGKLDITACPMENEVCIFPKCIMGDITHKLSTEFKAFLESQTLEDYL